MKFIISLILAIILNVTVIHYLRSIGVEMTFMKIIITSIVTYMTAVGAVYTFSK